ncbi:M23 family metallopeptidase [Chlamydiota bacterium]
MKQIKIIITIISSILLVPNNLYPENKYLWPVKEGKGVLSSSFMEFRRNHYHAGIDISTQRVKGIPAIALDDCSLYEINIAPFGYGRQIKLKLKNGIIVSYSHLEKYTDRIEKIVREGQLGLGSFNMRFQPKEGISFKRGEVIGIVGNTGGFKPHLHFEMQEGDDYINPLTNGLDYTGTFYPKIKGIAIVPLEEGASINGSSKKQIFSSWYNSKKNVYKIEDPISIDGLVGFEIHAYILTEQGNKLFPYRISLFSDDQLFFQIKTDKFKKNDYSQVFHGFDRGLYLHEKGPFIRLFTNEKGRINYTKGMHELKIKIDNFSQDTTMLIFSIETTEGTKEKRSFTNDEKPSIEVNGTEVCLKYDSNNLLLSFEEGTFHDTKYLSYKKSPFYGSQKTLQQVSSVYKLLPEDVIPEKKFHVFIKIPNHFKNNEKYIGLFQLEPQRIRFVGTNRTRKGYIGAILRYPSHILLMQDSKSPSITHIKPTHGSSIRTKTPILRASIIDKGSGLDFTEMHMHIDEKEVPAEYTIMSNEFIFYIKEQPLTKGMHTLKITALDKIGNKRTKKSEFWVK